MKNIRLDSNFMQTKTNYTLIVLCLSSVLVPFMTSAINLAIPDMNKDLHLDAIMTSWIQTSYMLATAILQIPAARLAEMYGQKRVFFLGVMIFSITAIFCGFVHTGELLILGRIGMGIGSAMMFGTTNAIVTFAVPKEKRGWALGMVISMAYISLAAGPLVGGVLTSSFGWESIFFVSAGLGFAVCIGTILFIKGEWKDTKRTPFDYIGSLLYSVSLFLIIYGFSSLPDKLGFACTLSGIILLIVFGKNQLKQTHPIFNVKEFIENRLFRLSNISALINYAATFAISFMLSLYLQYVRGLSPEKAGLILIIQALVMAVVAFLSGKLSDKASPTLLATLGMGIITVGLLMLCFITESTSYYYLGISLFILGLGFGVFSPPNTNSIMSSVESKFYSMASATTGTMRLVGQSLSMGVAMMALALTVGNTALSSENAPQILTSMHITFIVCTVFCIVGVFTSSVRGKTKC